MHENILTSVSYLYCTNPHFLTSTFYPDMILRVGQGAPHQFFPSQQYEQQTGSDGKMKLLIRTVATVALRGLGTTVCGISMGRGQ